MNTKGEIGRVYAFEPGPANIKLLRQNIEQNKLNDVVHVIERAASDEAIEYPYIDVDQMLEMRFYNYGAAEIREDGKAKVKGAMIDSLNLQKCRLIKIDAEGHELHVLRGAVKTLERCRPALYVEADRQYLQQELISWLVDHGYRCWWHKPKMFRPDNFNGTKRNVFGVTESIMLICFPESLDSSMDTLLEVADLRPDDEMFSREIERHRRFEKKQPDDLMNRAKIAHYLHMMHRYDEAMECVKENLRRDPEHSPSHSIIGLHALQRGDYQKGWVGYQRRLLQPDRKYFGAGREWLIPEWDGSPTEDPILIATEQGFGDNIMFARFMREVLERAPNAYLECVPELFELFEYSEIVPKGRLLRRWRTMPTLTAWCSVASLPYLFNAGVDMIRRKGPYLKADVGLTHTWSVRKEPPIAVCLRGSHRSERPYTRDFPQELLDKIAEPYGPFLTLEQKGQFDSFMDTAACISSRDLVISVDTSVVHLAGALGKETWLLNAYDCDWRWKHDGVESDWYESVRIFRQPKFRDWKSVAEEVRAALDERFAEDKVAAA
jgi:FkbM family methyltransferase